jgi:hypothetical protein
MHIGSRTQWDVMLGRDGGNGLVFPGHDRLQALVDLLSLPVKAGTVLHPFEIADGDATAVGEDIRHHRDTLGRQQIIGGLGHRAVGHFDDHRGSDPIRIGLGDDIFPGGGDQQIHVQLKEFAVAEIGGAGHQGAEVSVAVDRFEVPGLVLGLDQGGHIESGLVVDSAP